MFTNCDHRNLSVTAVLLKIQISWGCRVAGQAVPDISAECTAFIHAAQLTFPHSSSSSSWTADPENERTVFPKHGETLAQWHCCHIHNRLQSSTVILLWQKNISPFSQYSSLLPVTHEKRFHPTNKHKYNYCDIHTYIYIYIQTMHLPILHLARGKGVIWVHFFSCGSYFSTVASSVVPLLPPMAYTFPLTTAMSKRPRASFIEDRVSHRLVSGSYNSTHFRHSARS